MEHPNLVCYKWHFKIYSLPYVLVNPNLQRDNLENIIVNILKIA